MHSITSVVSQLRILIRSVWYAIRFFGRPIKVHPTSKVSWRSIFKTNCGGGKIVIGSDCEIHDYAMIMTYGGNITIGDHCSVNPFTIIYGHGNTQIGRGVRIAAHTVIIPSNHIPGDEITPSYKRGFTALGVRIEDYVWIGSGCRILDGVIIGRHAIVGAGSVVVHSVSDNVTVAGVPARPIKLPLS
ncbi:MAG: acyltransferase [Betaproteobacteria bacterium]|nr:acyltransferase [Betaproteobacteria bacterium]